MMLDKENKIVVKDLKVDLGVPLEFTLPELKIKHKNERDLEIPFTQIVPVMEMKKRIDDSCLDIIAYLTSNFYGIDGRLEQVAIDLALACERFVFGG